MNIAFFQFSFNFFHSLRTQKASPMVGEAFTKQKARSELQADLFWEKEIFLTTPSIQNQWCDL